MDNQTFLAHAVKLELDAEEIYLKAASLMKDQANRDAAAFFREMADFSRMHRETAMVRAGFSTMADIPGDIALWPGSNTESPDPKDFDKPLDLDAAMALALAAEQRGVSFYEEIARTTTDPQTRLLAEEYAEEERGHVVALERFMGIAAY
jgi:rubrerythrin